MMAKAEEENKKQMATLKEELDKTIVDLKENRDDYKIKCETLEQEMT